ncbi:MAG: hypothetical protein NZ580_05295 [Bacteroidia bacterium]|nr:hypothetical protein [Bacteroidia bacterium]MDW8236278.1 hypothetical protein [Bacteroidia bacterium]
MEGIWQAWKAFEEEVERYRESLQSALEQAVSEKDLGEAQRLLRQQRWLSKVERSAHKLKVLLQEGLSL